MNAEDYVGKTVRLRGNHKAMSGAVFPAGTPMIVESAALYHLHLVAVHACPSCGAAPQRLRAIRLTEVDIVEPEMPEP